MGGKIKTVEVNFSRCVILLNETPPHSTKLTKSMPFILSSDACSYQSLMRVFVLRPGQGMVNKNRRKITECCHCWPWDKDLMLHRCVITVSNKRKRGRCADMSALSCLSALPISSSNSGAASHWTAAAQKSSNALSRQTQLKEGSVSIWHLRKRVLQTHAAQTPESPQQHYY